MNEQTKDTSPGTLARIAGALYLINTVIGAFATGYFQHVARWKARAGVAGMSLAA